MSWVKNVILHFMGFVLNPEHNLKKNLKTLQYPHTQIGHVSIHPLRFKSCPSIFMRVECHINILMRSSKDSLESWTLVEDCVLIPIIEFCASPTEGC